MALSQRVELSHGHDSTATVFHRRRRRDSTDASATTRGTEDTDGIHISEGQMCLETRIATSNLCEAKT
eukprot:COSAG01_NODE_3567_length_5925_cov_14.275318_2_plen_68_part_00